MLALALVGLSFVRGVSASPDIGFSVDSTSGQYTVSVEGVPWYSSPTAAAAVVCNAGKQITLALTSTVSAAGEDAYFGTWAGTNATWSSTDASIAIVYTFKHFATHPTVGVVTMTFSAGLDTKNCGSNTALSTNFPSFDTSAKLAKSNHFLSWRGSVMDVTKASSGLENLGASGLDCGPVVSQLPGRTAQNALVWSTLDSHKIIPQHTANGIYSMGLAPMTETSIPAGFAYSAIFVASKGGYTSAMYEWGRVMQGYSKTWRLPSVTLTSVGYYTDDGAYYYVWGGGKEKHDPELSPWIPARPWPAEVGLMKVKEKLYEQGVPVAYMQLDDWWYQGPFYFGNVKAVRDWHASNSSGLFPSGLPAFADKLGLPLQLYTPFFDDNYISKYEMFENTQFKRTKVVVPKDSYPFFQDLFDLGLKETNGRMNTYEIDFMDVNFAGCADCFHNVRSADLWYEGLANAALERNISLQFCLASATDALLSLKHPAIVQARASGDYARPEGNTEPWGNTVTLGGASLLLGATAVAPSKDTLWTASPQPPTSSDRTHSGYTSQPHVDLDAVLAVLSLGPVGISDALGYTNVGLISQGFVSATNATLLRPSRPLSTLDSVWANASMVPAPACLGAKYPLPQCADARGAHAALNGGGPISHYLVLWLTTVDVALQPTDLYPAPSATTRLATREHIIAPPTLEAQQAGCVEGKKAADGCITILDKGVLPTLTAVGNNITDFSLTVVYEELANGAFFLGELTKFVHVSPQRFESVKVGGSGPSSITIELYGSKGETISLVSVDSNGVVHIKAVTMAGSSAKVEL